MQFSALRDINRTAWGTKLLLMAVLANPVYYISSCHIMKAYLNHTESWGMPDSIVCKSQHNGYNIMCTAVIIMHPICIEVL